MSELTAIVIMMGVAAFVLALVYRLFVINRDDDDVEDDEEDVKILSGSLGTAPDRDRSDDPLTHSDTPTGDPAVDAVLRAAARKLGAAGRATTLDGYERGGKVRAWDLAGAIWAALADHRLASVLPRARDADVVVKASGVTPESTTASI